jgi:DHA1 family bicyclomycin/chloramphenicol resistance-like MFS transporter
MRPAGFPPGVGNELTIGAAAKAVERRRRGVLRVRPLTEQSLFPPVAARPQPAMSRGLIVLLGALTAFGPMAIDMYLPSLPSIVRDLGGPPGAGQLTVAAFLAGVAIGQLVYGPLSDRIGRRRPLLAGIALFVAASIGCALAPNMPALIGLRFVQALGGCAGIVLARAVVRDLCDARQSIHVYSLLMLVMGVAPVVAPLVGGWLTTHLGWRSIFWILAGFGLLLLAAVALRLRESRPEETAVHARSETPLRAYLALLGDRQVMGYVLAGGLASATLFTYIAASPQVLIGKFGVPPQLFGLIFSINAVGVIGASQLNRRLSRRWHHLETLRAANLASVAAALAMSLAALTGALGMWGLLVPLFVVLAAFGIGPPNAMAGAMEAGGKRAGSTAAVYGFAQYTAGAGCAALASLVAPDPAVAMSLVMTGALLIAALVLRFMVRR